MRLLPSVLAAVLAATALPARAQSHTIYLSRGGGTYTPGVDDSRTNTSSVLSSTATVPAFACADPTWSEVVACVRDLFSRFDVAVTDLDPGSAAHWEVVVGGAPSVLGLPTGVTGVAPSACAVIPNGIAFVFSEQISCASARDLCEVAANQIGHVLGLDNEFLCADPMSYLSGCGPKSFQDAAAPCGEYAARTCACGGDTQNSVALLTAALGPAPRPAEPSSGGCGSAGGGGSAVAALLALAAVRRARRAGATR